ncbi:DUF86 domain-containing protein [Patescibacteria group bacterium]|nr:MAG: DUF86 domain-containing protein [Patescibacteria group bacterium]
MAKRQPEFFLEYILTSIEEIEKNAAKLTPKFFFDSTTIQDAIIRRLEIIGEACKSLPAGFKKKHPQVEWKKIAGTRDVLIHEYFGVDINLVWKIVENDIPKLKKEIVKILNLLGKNRLVK